MRWRQSTALVAVLVGGATVDYRTTGALPALAAHGALGMLDVHRTRARQSWLNAAALRVLERAVQHPRGAAAVAHSDRPARRLAALLVNAPVDSPEETRLLETLHTAVTADREWAALLKEWARSDYVPLRRQCAATLLGLIEAGEASGTAALRFVGFASLQSLASTADHDVRELTQRCLQAMQRQQQHREPSWSKRDGSVRVGLDRKYNVVEICE
eukprot:TRINITY_DN3737_c0_g1_i3.p1 TRINITY_DN3737_c0_g1~~TRINITY_DN3737_c0_g1_i3.p1  ORF type:complete len:215 (+),score=71.56 TRINITY_DN3737_c0_g1_i3:103-747(+)